MKMFLIFITRVRVFFSKLVLTKKLINKKCSKSSREHCSPLPAFCPTLNCQFIAILAQIIQLPLVTFLVHFYNFKKLFLYCLEHIQHFNHFNDVNIIYFPVNKTTSNGLNSKGKETTTVFIWLNN